MKKIRSLLSIGLVCFSVTALGVQKSSETVRENALADLSFVSQVIKTKYMPLNWKQQLFGWDLAKETARARSHLWLSLSPTVKDCQIVLANYLGSLNDYHAGFRFYSTENSYLPLVCKRTVDGRVFIVDIYSFTSDVSIGDEIIGFDDKSTSMVLESLLGGDGTLTDYSIATRDLTFQSGSMGRYVPKGYSRLRLKKPDNSIKTALIQWNHTPEGIMDLAKVHSGFFSINSFLPVYQEYGKQKLQVNMMPVFWEIRKGYEQNFKAHGMGARDGFLPTFGSKILWEQQTGPFRAYICKVMDPISGVSKNLGFIRIPTYSWDENESQGKDDSEEKPWQTFGKIVAFMQNHTDGLIIDQQNNPGGSVFYMYALISRLTDFSIKTPLHYMTITQEEVQSSLGWLELLRNVSTDDQAREIIGDDLEGLHIDMRGARALKDFSQKIIKEWEFGRYACTNPLPLLGFDKIYPNPDQRYTKPIIMLINEECYSCGDLMPAIMKDNSRALLIGQTTAGAGGFVYQVEFPNRSGIKFCTLTGSLALRKDGSYIENKGVSPDVLVNFTAEDLQSGLYRDYMDTVEKLALSWIQETSSSSTTVTDPEYGTVLE